MSIQIPPGKAFCCAAEGCDSSSSNGNMECRIGHSQKGRACASSDETRFRPQVSEAQPMEGDQLGAKSTSVLVAVFPGCVRFFLGILC